MLPVLAVEIHKRLYPRSGVESQEAEIPKASAADSILRLPQEYETAFGRTTLHHLLQQLIRGDDLKPGQMHSRFLQLPWRDVFTTNWDTLLERARSQVMDRAYSIVRNMDELPLANRPRIVKLHGSFPSEFPLIFTEEDYRTYPTKFAPFVNTAQQAMTETVFCLIGFSGNDPNFLKWSGWLRDNLGASAPRIYLAGWLDLLDHQRRMLESRGVVLIDLARHPKAHKWPEHQRHSYAIEWILHTLERGRPYDFTYWPSPLKQPYPVVPQYFQPVVDVISRQPKEESPGERDIDKDELQETVKETLDTWRHNRQVYPGWLLLPAGEAREILPMRTDSWERHILVALPGLTAAERLNAIYELIWRREILLEPMSDELESAAVDALKQIDCHTRTISGVAGAGISWSEVRERWRTVGLALITSARLRFDAELFDKRTEAIEPFVNDHPDVYHQLFQERCLRATYAMDFESLERLLDDWTVRESDSIWMIRKAALLWESDRNNEAIELVQHALDTIRSIPDAEGSVARSSREGWALWSAFTKDNRREFRKKWEELAALKCDAMLERDLITRRVGRADKSEEAPDYDLGVRRVLSIRFSPERPDLGAYRAVRLSEVAGLPPATKHDGFVGTGVASDILKLAAEQFAASQPELAIRLVLRVCGYEKDKVLMRILSRTRVALLSANTVEAIAQTCMEVIQYTLPRVIPVGTPRPGVFWIERLRVALEVLSRLVLRLPPAKLEATLEKALECYRSPKVSQEPWLGEPVSNLLRRSWEALPTERRTPRSIDLLNMPIVGLDNFSGSITSLSPDPGDFLRVDDLPAERKPEDDSRWLDVIDFLVRGLEGDEEPRKRASLRILLVSDKGLLTATELSTVAQALWSDKHTAPDGLPAGTSIYDWVFLLLPEPNPGIAEQRFRFKWLSGDATKLQGGVQRDGNTVSIAIGASPMNPDSIDDILWNVGAAMSSLRKRGQMLQLTGDEQKYVTDVVEQWVTTDVPLYSLPFFQGAAREPTRRAMLGLASILAEEVISVPADERLYKKLRRLADSGTPGFELIAGLIRTMPDRFDELVTWLRMGLVSDDRALAASAMSGLHSWMVASIAAGESLRPPPDDMLREVGFMIASRRSVSLAHALQLAKWVFSEGTQGHRDAMSALTIQGLSYLAEELQYDREGDAEGYPDLPLLRWLCVQLALTMAQSGFGDVPTVDH